MVAIPRHRFGVAAASWLGAAAGVTLPHLRDPLDQLPERAVVLLDEEEAGDCSRPAAVAGRRCTVSFDIGIPDPSALLGCPDACPGRASHVTNVLSSHYSSSFYENFARRIRFAADIMHRLHVRPVQHVPDLIRVDPLFKHVKRWPHLTDVIVLTAVGITG
jgi:hypothetical protein